MGSPPTLIIFAILRSENMKIAIYTRVSTLEQKEKVIQSMNKNGN